MHHIHQLFDGVTARTFRTGRLNRVEPVGTLPRPCRPCAQAGAGHARTIARLFWSSAGCHEPGADLELGHDLCGWPMSWQIEGDYARDGAVCVRGAFDAAAVEMARAAIEANLADLSPTATQHRHYLFAALQAQGFVNYPFEWWHWSYGDKY